MFAENEDVFINRFPFDILAIHCCTLYHCIEKHLNNLEILKKKYFEFIRIFKENKKLKTF